MLDQSAPPFAVRASPPFPPDTLTAPGGSARRRSSPLPTETPTGAQFLPASADTAVAPAWPTAAASVLVLNAAARILRSLDGTTDVIVFPPLGVRSSWSPWRVAIRQRLGCSGAQRMPVRSAAGSVAGRSSGVHVTPPSVV